MCEVCRHSNRSHRRGLARREALALALGFAANLAAPLEAFADADEQPPPKPQNVVSPNEALERLMEGNARYVSGFAKGCDFLAERQALVSGQNPLAGVLSCADSRVAPEFVFDACRGDLFVCRVAGNFANPDNIASFEYAVDALKTPLILVLGHESCGAVKAAVSSVDSGLTLPGHLPSLVDALAPAVEATANEPGDRVLNATLENIRRNVEALKTTAPILSAAVAESRIKVVGGLYRLQTGQVELIA